MAGESVLIVGEDGIIAFHLHCLLLEAGYIPEDPITTKEVTDRFSTRPFPDLIVLDEGCDTTENHRIAYQIFQKCDIPFIILTSFSDTREPERRKGMPRTLFIPKPFSGNEILLVVRKILDGNPQ